MLEKSATNWLKYFYLFIDLFSASFLVFQETGKHWWLSKTRPNKSAAITTLPICLKDRQQLEWNLFTFFEIAPVSASLCFCLVFNQIGLEPRSAELLTVQQPLTFNIFWLVQFQLRPEGRPRRSSAGSHGRRWKACSVQDRQGRALTLCCHWLWRLRQEDCQLPRPELLHHEVHRACHRVQHQLHAALLQGFLMWAFLGHFWVILFLFLPEEDARH